MQSWLMENAAQPQAERTVAGVISAIGRERFGERTLGLLAEALRVGSWAVYQVWPDRPPVLHLSAARAAVDCTVHCFATYRDAGLYLGDRSFEPARSSGPGSAVMLRMHADDAPAAHRHAIYRRHGMLERLSVARAEQDDSVLAVNVYRHDDEGCFGEADVGTFGTLALPLIAAVARHLQWHGDEAAPAVPDRRAQLRRHCPALTERELDVLERMLRGMTYDGIAADMELGVGTVKTYRARAFERLDIHFKNELFALFMPAGRAPPSSAAHRAGS
ncbi:helix-turn-helix transcriptional regulator [Aquincola sp. MAHUQ-54]|uniref:Helix-turn-helix transcriptional regulator n=1 Tax=Aquincola agrisoli TaxID=3119538 RepID=A0AAW9PXW7_9BURK